MGTDGPDTLILLRHGSTALNESGTLMSKSDPGLSSHGVVQVDAAARYICDGYDIDRLLTSEAQRSMATATAVGARCEVEVKTASGLRERHLGPFEGMSASELRDERTRLNLGIDDMTLIWEGVEAVESDREVFDRFWAEVANASGGNGTICCVTHAGAMKAVIHRLLNVPSSRPYAFRFGLGCVVELHRTRGRYEMYSFWQNPHVKPRYLD